MPISITHTCTPSPYLTHHTPLHEMVSSIITPQLLSSTLSTPASTGIISTSPYSHFTQTSTILQFKTHPTLSKHAIKPYSRIHKLRPHPPPLTESIRHLTPIPPVHHCHLFKAFPKVIQPRKLMLSIARILSSTHFILLGHLPHYKHNHHQYCTFSAINCLI